MAATSRASRLSIIHDPVEINQDLLAMLRGPYRFPTIHRPGVDYNQPKPEPEPEPVVRRCRRGHPRPATSVRCGTCNRLMTQAVPGPQAGPRMSAPERYDACAHTGRDGAR